MQRYKRSGTRGERANDREEREKSQGSWDEETPLAETSPSGRQEMQNPREREAK